jgi:hypothetical protein
MADEYYLAVLQETGYLRITATGDRTVPRTEYLLQIALAEAQARGADRVLLDTSRLTGALSVSTRYTLAELVGQVFGGAGIKLALFTSSEAAAPLTRTLILSRGIDSAVFDSEAEALAWLLELPSS